MSQEQNQEQAENLLNSANISVPNRRMRRMQMRASGILRIKNMFDYNTEVGRNYRAQQQESGRKLMQQTQDRMDQSITEQSMIRMEKLKSNWKDSGYSSEEITMLEEAYALMDVKIWETYREDRKRAKQLLKEVEASRLKRMNG